MSRSLKDKLTTEVCESLIRQSPDKSNSGKYLWPIYYWQILSAFAEASFKEAWQNAVTAKVVSPDEELRQLGAGEHLLTDSKLFSAMVTVSKPRTTFDRELFIDTVAKKYKLDKVKLVALAESCKTQGNPALTKRVVEAAS